MLRHFAALLLVAAACAQDTPRAREDAGVTLPPASDAVARPALVPAPVPVLVRRDLDSEATVVVSERSIAVRRGALMTLRIPQPGYDVGIEIARPGASPPKVVDFVHGGHGEERFVWLATEDETLTVRVLVPVDRAAAGLAVVVDVDEQLHPDARAVARAEAFGVLVDADADAGASDASTLRRAVARAGQAAKAFERLGDGTLQASALQLEVNALFMLDAYRPCVDAAGRGIAVAAGGLANDIELRRMRGQCLFALGDVGGAEKDWTFVRDHAAEDMNRYGGAAAAHQLARLYAVSGRYREALGSYHDALRTAELLGMRKLQAFGHSGLGVLHRDLGHADPALAHLAAASELFAATGRVRAQAGALHDVGVTRRDLLGDADGAMRAFEAASRLLQNTGSLELTSTLANAIGALLHARGELDAARASIERARAIAVEAGLTLPEANALASLGHIQRTAGAATEAVRTLTSATALFRRVDAVGRLAAAESELALALRDAGRHADAERSARAAVATVESIQSILAPELRSAQFATVEQIYDALVDVLLSRPSRDAAPAPADVVEALRESDAARARTLLARIMRREGALPLDPPPELVAARDAALRDLGVQQARQTALARHGAPSERQAAAARALRDATVRHRHALDRLLAATPATTLLLRPPPLDVDALARKIGLGGVLLHFALAEERSHVWIVTSGGVRVVTLPREAELAGAVAGLRRAIDEERRYVPGEGDAAAARRTRVEAERAHAAERLAGWLLGGVDELRGAGRVFVVADGCLSDVPFALLPDPRSGAPLVLDHEITMLPSSGALLALGAAASAARRGPQKIVVLADPVFAMDDPRVRARAAGGAAPDGALSPAATPAADDDDDAWGSRWRSLPRLRFSRNEASAIATLDPGAELRLDFAASKEWLTTADLRGYRVVHIATHGLVDARQPELSGLALSSVDRDGGARDGFLKLDDVYRLRLDADLVVLSACDSARGQTLSGEGVVGLTRAFLHAGARRVLSTSWAVNDRATGELLARFYRAHLQGGHSPARALAMAQREAARLSVSPVDWAGFALHGLE